MRRNDSEERAVLYGCAKAAVLDLSIGDTPNGSGHRNRQHDSPYNEGRDSRCRRGSDQLD